MLRPAIILAAILLTSSIVYASGNDQAPSSTKALPPLPAPMDPIDAALGPTAEQIKMIHKKLDERERAAYSQPTTPSRPMTRSVDLDLSPGSTPPVIRVSPRNGAIISFSDVTGAPWPIENQENFAKKTFDVDVPIKKGAMLSVSSRGDYGDGNIAVFLKGLDTPITLTVLGGQRETDYRVDIRLPLKGPGAKPQIISTGTSDDFDPALSDILDGLPPSGATEVHVTGGHARAWLYKGNLYLRTTMLLMSPAWRGKYSSSDGTFAYRLDPTPIVLVSDDGKEIQLTVGD